MAQSLFMNCCVYIIGIFWLNDFLENRYCVNAVVIKVSRSPENHVCNLLRRKFTLLQVSKNECSELHCAGNIVSTIQQCCHQDRLKSLCDFEDTKRKHISY